MEQTTFKNTILPSFYSTHYKITLKIHTIAAFKIHLLDLVKIIFYFKSFQEKVETD